MKLKHKYSAILWLIFWWHCTCPRPLWFEAIQELFCLLQIWEKVAGCKYCTVYDICCYFGRSNLVVVRVYSCLISCYYYLSQQLLLLNAVCLFSFISRQYEILASKSNFHLKLLIPYLMMMYWYKILPRKSNFFHLTLVVLYLTMLFW